VLNSSDRLADHRMAGRGHELASDGPAAHALNQFERARAGRLVSLSPTVPAQDWPVHEATVYALGGLSLVDYGQ